MAYMTLWWVWMAAALVLGLVEILVPGFIFLGFAIGAAIVGIVVLLGGSLLSAPFILLLFAVFSLMAWYALRQIFALPTGQVKTFENDINDH